MVRPLREKLGELPHERQIRIRKRAEEIEQESVILGWQKTINRAIANRDKKLLDQVLDWIHGAEMVSANQDWLAHLARLRSCAEEHQSWLAKEEEQMTDSIDDTVNQWRVVLHWAVKSGNIDTVEQVCDWARGASMVRPGHEVIETFVGEAEVARHRLRSHKQ